MFQQWWCSSSLEELNAGFVAVQLQCTIQPDFEWIVVVHAEAGPLTSGRKPEQLDGQLAVHDQGSLIDMDLVEGEACLREDGAIMQLPACGEGKPCCVTEHNWSCRERWGDIWLRFT